MLSGLATFLPILSFAVPWSGEILIYLSPRVILIALNLNKFLNGIELDHGTSQLPNQIF